MTRSNRLSRVYLTSEKRGWRTNGEFLQNKLHLIRIEIMEVLMILPLGSFLQTILLNTTHHICEAVKDKGWDLISYTSFPIGH